MTKISSVVFSEGWFMADQKGFPRGYSEFQPPKSIFREPNNWPIFMKAEHDFRGSVGTWPLSNGSRSERDF